ncbi:hypothetical protein A0J61_11680 [Choanephora cucurbitarum]|uniref:CENP-V/GFA domain-containing protein n=1 Tax=Choanephora cucurbitarum TaxID=101091 RepID=A0A1C7MTV2_9FUNG|nr:hypothetical protein A0J61_11680 [Choanephora cucurbitarum]
MSTIYHGSCICGAIQFNLTGPPIRNIICHCSDCQKSGGSAFQTSSAYAPSQVQLIDPDNQLKTYIVPAESVGSGFEKHKHFCGRCGCPIYNVPMKEEGKQWIIKTGLIETSEGGSALHALKELQPQAEVYTRSRAGYLTAINNVNQFETGFQPL